MKYISKYNESKTHNEIHEKCEYYNITNYTINKDGSIDVDGNVDLIGKGLKELPLIFNKVNGWFSCSINQLTSLIGAPKYVGDSFYCSNNKLISLYGCPDHIGGIFYIENNNIYTFEKFPKYIGEDYNFSINPIDFIYNLYIKSIDNIEVFNEFRIINGNVINLNRLKDYAKLNNYQVPIEPALLARGYIIK